MNNVPNITAWLRMFRMKRKSSSYDAQLVSIPSVIIGVGWIMLWMLWPQGDKLVARRQIPMPVRVSFVQAGDSIFSIPVVQSSKTLPGDSDAVAVMPWLAPRPARLLEMSTFTGADSVNRSINRFQEYIDQRSSTYRPMWDDVLVYPVRSGGGTMRLVIEITGGLRDAGFQLPEIHDVLKSSDKPWSITVFVEAGSDGKVQNIFLCSGSENKEINSMVVKSVYRGKLARIGKKCEGRVRIDFGSD